MQKPVIYKYFDDVAAASPIPILLYNFPGVTGGIDLDSDTIINLAASNKNVVGCKLTCGNMGKLQRVAHDPRINREFAAFAGKTDFMLHGLVGGSHGVIAATANLVPKLHNVMLDLYDEGKLKEAQELQTRFSRADWALVQLGVAGLKAALEKYYGYGAGRSRRPRCVLSMAPPHCWARAAGCASNRGTTRSARRLPRHAPRTLNSLAKPILVWRPGAPQEPRHAYAHSDRTVRRNTSMIIVLAF